VSRYIGRVLLYVQIAADHSFEFFMTPTPKNLLIAGTLVLIAVLLLLPFDVRLMAVAQHLSALQRQSLVKLLSNKGIYPLYGIFLALFIYALIKKKRDLRQACLTYLQVQFLFSILLIRLMKIVFGRARPAAGGGFEFFSMAPGDDAFPSGHSADVFVSATFLCYLFKHSGYSQYRYLPIIYAVILAITRVLINAHFPADVLAGSAIGVLGSWYFLNRLSKKTATRAAP